MGIATATLLHLPELEFDGQLLRFHTPLAAELELIPGEGASVWVEELQLGATGSSEREALEMFADLLITAYTTYRAADPATLSSGAMEQWAKLRSMASGVYVLQH